MIADTTYVSRTGVGTERLFAGVLLFPCHKKRNPAYFHTRGSRNGRTDHEHVYQIPPAFIPYTSFSLFMQGSSHIEQCTVDDPERVSVGSVVEVPHGYDMSVFKRVADLFQGSHSRMPWAFGFLLSAIFGWMMIYYEM